MFPTRKLLPSDYETFIREKTKRKTNIRDTIHIDSQKSRMANQIQQLFVFA